MLLKYLNPSLIVMINTEMFTGIEEAKRGKSLTREQILRYLQSLGGTFSIKFLIPFFFLIYARDFQ